MKRLVLTLTATLMCWAAWAYIPVGAGGSGTLTLDTLPAASEWATFVLPGVGTTYQNEAALDAGAQTLSAAAITTQLPTSGTTPPSTSSLGFRYNTTWLLIQSRPTTSGTNAANVLKATLRNTSGSAARSLSISYDQGLNNTEGGELPGMHVYYSLSGDPGTWVKIPELSGIEAVATLTANVQLNDIWAPDTDLYIVWVDDNADGVTDESYTIDNVVFNLTPAVGVVLTRPSNGAIFSEGEVITLAASAALPGNIQNVNFYTGTTLIGGDNVAPYELEWTTAPLGTHNLTAVANDDQGNWATSSIVTITVEANLPPAIAITNLPPTGWSVLVGTAITNIAVATDSRNVAKVEWYLGWGAPLNQTNLVHLVTNASGSTNFVSTYILADSLAWTNLNIIATAYDRAGVKTSTSVSVTVTNPGPNFYVALPNGGDWWYYIAVTGAPPVIGGLNWYEAGYVPDEANGWTNGIAELGYGDAANNYPERTTIPTPPSGSRYTVYFVKQFLFDDDPWNYLSMKMRLLRDDGAIVWLNSQAIWTNNVTVFPADWNTFSGADAGDENAIQETDIFNPADFLISSMAGANTVAVEVHQANATSSDLSFDFMLWTEIFSNPTVDILTPTNGQRFAEGSAPTVDVAASTYVSYVDFYYDDLINPIGQDNTPDANHRFQFTIPDVGAVGDHVIRVVGWDDYGNSGEDQITITVVPNQPPVVAITNTVGGPVVLVGTPVTNYLSVADPDGTVTNLSFWLYNPQTEPVPFQAANRAANFSPVIVLDLRAGTNWMVAVATDNRGLMSTSAPVAVLATNPPDPITILVPNGQVWWYWASNTTAGGSEPPLDDQGRAWYATFYDGTNYWMGAGEGELGGGDGTQAAAVDQYVERTVIPVGDSGARYSYYFLRDFQFAGDPATITNLIINSLHDDTSTVFLNGTPIYTNNITQDPLVYTSLGVAAINHDGTRYLQGTYPAEPGLLLVGRNRLAVVVKMNSTTSSDVSFDLMLWGEQAGECPPVAEFKIEINDPDPLDNIPGVPTITWAPAAYKLVTSDDVTAPLSTWTEVPGATSPYTPTIQPGKRFYALRCP